MTDAAARAKGIVLDWVDYWNFYELGDDPKNDLIERIIAALTQHAAEAVQEVEERTMTIARHMWEGKVAETVAAERERICQEAELWGRLSSKIATANILQSFAERPAPMWARQSLAVRAGMSAMIPPRPWQVVPTSPWRPDGRCCLTHAPEA